jgi:site-specific recombinase XerD
LAGIHALARFVGKHSPEHVQWCGQIRLIPFKRTDEPAITALDVDEMNALLATPDRLTTQGERDYVLLLFLYNSGARASEAAQFKMGDIDWYTDSVQIIGKGKKRRSCPLWKLTLSTLNALTDEHPQNESVFLNRSGQSMTRSGVHGLVKRLATRACVSKASLANKTIGPHVIRHRTATHLLRAGVDINTIRVWLGHVSVNTTNKYAEIDLETKARALAACSVSEEQGSVVSWRERKTLLDFLSSL